MTKYITPLFLIALFAFNFSCDTKQKEETITTSDILAETFADAAVQYKVLRDSLPEGQFPKTFENDTLKTSGSEWWCSGFYPGTLLYIYEQTKDQEIYEEAFRILKDLEKEQFNTTTHDLGFMMYCSFGHAKLLEPKEEYVEILINSANSLASRFDPTVGCIKSWDGEEDEYLVIIDNMMNLELLFWATQATGDSSYYDIAVTHANTTLANHFREDNSSYHVLNYSASSGEVKEKKTHQGYSDDSAWARGQAWGFYGYTSMYRFTKDITYLNQAVNIAEFLLNHENMPEDNIPYWDFNAPDIPEAKRDASAAAILASGLLELIHYVEGEQSEKYFNVAESILMTLASEEYFAAPGTNGGFLLMHGLGHMPAGTEVDVPLTYGDYYFVEAMSRYLEL